MSDKRFILWDPKDGEVRRDGDTIVSDGILGRMSQHNPYLTAYAKWHGKLPEDLNVGESCLGTWSLSGSRGTYRCYRIA